jgi:hypothetical protein
MTWTCDCKTTNGADDSVCGECGRRRVSDPEMLAQYEELLKEFASDGVLDEVELRELAALRVELGVSIADHEALVSKYAPQKTALSVSLAVDEATLSGFVAGTTGFVRVQVRNAGERILRNVLVRYAVSGESAMREHGAKTLRGDAPDEFGATIELPRHGQYMLELVVRAEDMLGKSRQAYRAEPVGFAVAEATTGGGPSTVVVHANVDASAMRVAGDPLAAIHVGGASRAGQGAGALSQRAWRSLSLRPITTEEWEAWAHKRDAGARARVEAEARAKLEAEAQARSRVEAEARAAEEARLRAEAEARARVEAEAQARARAEAEARAKVEAEAKAARERQEAEARAARAREEEAARQARERAAAEARAKAEAEARAAAESRARAEAAATVSCPACGLANRPNKKFCAGCGTVLAAAEARARAEAAAAARCPACGRANGPHYTFCLGCGTALAAAEARARAEAAVGPAWRQAWMSSCGQDSFGAWAVATISGVEVKFRFCPAGRFMMGSPGSEEGRRDNEGPQHEVELTRGFWLGEAPVTQRLWEAVTGSNPSRFKGSDRPVENVSWDDCVAFLGRVNGASPGLDLRLPTEAEWEYACRAGTTGPTYAGKNDASTLAKIAWYNDTGKHPFFDDIEPTRAVDQKAANP